MRELIERDLRLGVTAIEQLEIDVHSRDDIPQILLGLQSLYCDPVARDALFEVLGTVMPEETSWEVGRPGMPLWVSFVLAVLRLGLNCDYDRLQELANEHTMLRQMLGHGPFDVEQRYGLQTLSDNLSRYTPEVLGKLSAIVVRHGLRLLGARDEPLLGRCDSFVVETDVHYPTDTNLLWDAMRKVVRLSADAADLFTLPGWRQSGYIEGQIRKRFRHTQTLRASTSQHPEKKAQRQAHIKEAHAEYLAYSGRYLERAKQTLQHLNGTVQALEIQRFVAHAERQIEQIRRRVLEGETIPHHEKVFSVFEEHTEWVSKGKAGVPVELGLRVCVLEERHGFVLHHRVMQHEGDHEVAVTMVEQTRKRFPKLRLCSFDKGFYTPDNRRVLEDELEKVVMPKKGRRSAKDQAHESEPEFAQARRKHSAVESAINALEVHGLDRCPDHGIDGFERYAAMAMLSRNLQRVGAIVQQQEREEQAKEKKRRQG